MKAGLRYVRLSAATIAMLYGASRAAADNLLFDPSPSNPSAGAGSPTGSNASGNWDGSSTDWYSAALGADTTFNSATPDSAVFGGYNISPASSGLINIVTLGSNVTAQNITFNTSSTGAAYNIYDNEDGGQTLTLAGNVTKATGYGNPEFFLYNAIQLTSGNHVFAINDTGGDAAPELKLDSASGGAVLAGPGSITIDNGAYGSYGTVQLTTDNTYSGGTNISNGRLEILSGGGLGSGNVLIGGKGNLALGGSTSPFSGGQTIGNAIVITRNTYAGGDFGDYADAITANNVGGAKTYTFTGPLTVDSTDARIGAFTNTIVIPANIAQGPDVAAGMLTLDGDFAGYVTLTGDNSALKGGIQLVGGVELNVYNQSNLGGATSPLTFNGSGTLHPVGGFMSDFGQHVINATTFNGGIDIDAGQSFTVSNLSGGSIGKRGTGTLNLNGTNVFTGTPFYDAGIVNINGSTTFGSFRLRSPVVNVNDGATLTTTSSFTDIGSDSPDNGTLNVLGSGRLVLANQDFNVSDNAGTGGTLNLTGTSVTTNLGNSYFGKSTGSTGTLNMNGSSSFTTNQALVFGRNAGATGSATVGGAAVLAANGSSAGPNYGIGIGIAGGTGTLTMTGGTVNANANVGGSLALGNANGAAVNSTGTLVLSGGTINVAGETWVGSTDNTNNSTTDAGQGHAFATVQMTGGTLVGNSWIAVGRFGAQGTFNLSGGQVVKQGGNNAYVGETNPAVTSVLNISGTGFWNNSTGEFWVGQGGGVGVLNVSQAGSLVANSWLAIGRAGGVGTVNLAGGTLTQQSSNHLTIGSGGSGTVNVSGGVLTGLNTYVGETGTGTYGILNVNGGAVVLNGTTTFGNGGSVAGTLNLNAGTLTAAQLVAGTSTGAQTFNFGGGSLVASASSTAFMTGLTTNVLAAGAPINSSTYAITIATPLLGSTGSPGGGLTKSGAGSLTLAGSNTYTGRTTVAAGTLVSANVAAIPAGTALTVAPNSAVNFNGEYLQPAGSATPGLTLSSLTAGAGDTFGFNAASGGIDYVAFTGASTVTGANTINLSVPAGAAIAPGTYNLFTDSAGGLGNLFSLTINGTSGTSFITNGAQYNVTFVSNDQYDRLTIGAGQIAKLYYTGTGGTDATTAGVYSTDVGGTNPATSAPTSITDLVFTANANVVNAAPTVNAALTVNSLEFNASSPLTLGGTGTITLAAGANTFAAGTGIVADAGSAAVTLSANLSLPASTTFITNSANPLTLSGSIGTTASSGFTLTYNGSGAGGFVVSGANAYAGATTVNGPALQLGNGAALGAVGNTLNLVAGSVDLFGQAVSQSSLNLSGGQLLGSLGTGTLTLSASGGPAVLFATGGTAYNSLVAAVSGKLNLTGATNFIAKATGVGNPVISGAILLGGNTIVATADTSGDYAAELALSGAISGTGSLTLANNAAVAGVTFANQSDYGTLLVSASNSYSGGTNINYGRLVISNGNALGTGPVTVAQTAASGGTLQLGDNGDGTGNSYNTSIAVGRILTGITVPNAVTLAGAIAGDYGAGLINNQGSNTFTGNVTLNASLARIQVDGGSLTVSGPINQASGVTASLGTRGNSTLVLSGSNTYTGQTIISAGTLSVSDIENGGVASNIGASPTVATGAVPNLLLNGGTLAYTGTSSTTNRGYQIQATSTLNTGSGSLTFGGQVLATGGAFTKIGAGTVAYTNTAGLNTFETATGYGAFLVNQGTVVLGAPGATASGQTNSIPGELDVSGTGALGYAEADVNGGTTNVGGYVTISRGNSTTNLTSTLNVGGDAVFNVGNASFGYSNNVGSYNASGTVNISGTAVVTDAAVFRVAESTGSKIVVNMGGTSQLIVRGAANNGLQVGYQGIATFNQNGGTVVTTNPVQLGSNVAAASGTYTLGNGTVAPTTILRTTGVAGGSGASTFNFNGGTLQANGSSATFVTGLTHAYVGAVPAVIDTNTYAVTVPQVLATNPAVTTDAGLSKVGAGSLTLTGVNTYLGPTVVNVGTLATGATGSFGAGNVSAAAGATLTLGNGTSVSDGATLSFYDTSVVNLNAAAGTSETVLALSNLGTGTTFAVPGVYTAAQLDAQFSDSAFASLSGETLTIIGTPEPASLLLLGGAIAPLALGRRRRRAMRSPRASA